jgi:hypothetical protein
MMRAALIAPLALLAVGCASPLTNDIQASDPATFAAGRSYAIEPQETPAASPLAASVRAAVESEITKSLGSKGYEPVGQTAAQLKITYRLVPTGSRPREERVPEALAAHVSMGAGDPYSGYRPPAGADAPEKFGMLLLTVTDVKSGKVVWQATSEGSATSESSVVSVATQATRAVLDKVPRAAR